MIPSETAPAPATGAADVSPPVAIRVSEGPSQIQKAAIIMAAIGPEQAANVLREISSPDMERFAKALGGLGKIEQEVLDGVIVEFLEMLTRGPELQGGSKTARALLGTVSRRG